MFLAVGAGAAGSVVASRLSEEPCVSVLLLEAGGKPPLINDIPALARAFWFTKLDWAYKTVPQKHTGSGLINKLNIPHLPLLKEQVSPRPPDSPGTLRNGLSGTGGLLVSESVSLAEDCDRSEPQHQLMALLVRKMNPIPCSDP
ncbi:glucose dehydrogenase [Trichonephila clavipes]|nr:glucose dehydrogenase [Trichonephila clavipes]